MSQRGKLCGIFTPNMVPLDADGRINESELRRMIDWLIANGISGLYPNGSTGEFTRFSFEERKQIIRIVADQVAGRVPILAGASEANIEMTLEACAYYAELGCTAAAICGPYYYKLSQESVCEYFSELARRSPLDIFVYNIPQFANPIGLECMKQLCRFPRIIGTKDSSRDMPHFLNLINEVRPLRPDFTFLIGCEEMLLPAILMGADGGTVATSGVVPEVVMKLYHCAVNGQLDEARRIQFKLLELINTMLFGADFPEGVRVAIELRGFRMGQGRQKLSPKQQCDVARIRRTIQCILAEHGFADRPVGGCDVPEGAATSDAVDTIVSRVMRQLGDSTGRA